MEGATQQVDVTVSDELLRQKLKRANDTIATLQQQLNQLQEETGQYSRVRAERLDISK